MKTITLKRISSSDKGTFGVLLDGNYPICLTMELPWRDNKVSKSCIPTGRYTCGRYYRKSHGYYTYHIRHVPDRSEIIFHIGNTLEDTEGCILLGSRFYEFNSGVGIGNSTGAFNKFIDYMENIEEFTLEVTRC